ncbi:MAG TPA: hypothetical protein VG714_00255 [Acidobacteriaceae bacterium]|nr:hypothetical protein [Acidobacteriaceae bacterium]
MTTNATIPDIEQDAPARIVSPAVPSGSGLRRVEWVLLAVVAIFYLLHFVHLSADFPNRSPWSEWAKYTDEGWYGAAAIRHYQLGRWDVPGDFNPAAAVPVWPLLELALFRVTGVSLVAARALTVVLFGLTLVCSYILLRRWAENRDPAAFAGKGAVPLGPAAAVLLLATSPFFFAFTRLAVLETPLMLLGVVGLLVAQNAGTAAVTAKAAMPRGWNRRRALAWAALLGLTLVGLVLTKTTGVFLFPAILWMLWAACDYRLRLFAAAGAAAVGTAAIVWGGYMLLLVRPHYLADYRYLFAANEYTGITMATFWAVVKNTFESAELLGKAIFWIGVVSIAAAVIFLAARRHLRGDGLAVSLLLWVGCYTAFLAYHDNLSPRYYQTMGLALVLLIAMVFEAVWSATAWRAARFRLLAAGAATALLLTAAFGAAETIGYVRHPEYTFVHAAERLRDVVKREQLRNPAHSPMVLSISGADLSLMTGLPSICDDFGTMTLPDRVETYRPGWFAAWNYVEDDKMEALAPMYRVVRVAEFPAFDDPDRNLLILYRLDPRESPGRGQARRRRTIRAPRRLQTRMGEQPTVKQLEH